MRKLFLIFGLLAFGFPQLFAQSDEVINIPLEGSDATLKTYKPNAPVYLPVECYYNISLESFVFYFIGNAEDVHVSVSNLITGEFVTENVPSGCSGIWLPVTSTSGAFFVCVTYPNGDIYSGVCIL